MGQVVLETIGVWHTPIKKKQEAPKQGAESGILGEIELDNCWVEGLTGIKPGAVIWVLSCFNRANDPEVMVHPRGDKNNSQTGLFNTRSPNRPAPIGMTLVEVLSIEGSVLRVKGTDALNGTPILDIKPHVPRLDTPKGK